MAAPTATCASSKASSERAAPAAAVPLATTLLTFALLAASGFADSYGFGQRLDQAVAVGVVVALGWLLVRT